MSNNMESRNSCITPGNTAQSTQDTAYRNAPHTGNIPTSLLALLNAAFAEDPRPEGIPEEVWSEITAWTLTDADCPDNCDLHTLWSAMITATQEVKLQGRAFKELSTSLHSLGNVEQAMAGMTELHRQALAQAQDNTERAANVAQAFSKQYTSALRRDIENEMLEVFLDIHERLQRGLRMIEEQVEQTRKVLTGTLDACRQETGIVSLLTRLQAFLDQKQLPHPLAQLLDDIILPLKSVRWVMLADKQINTLADNLKSVEQGYRICLARLEDVLNSMNVELIPAMGLEFDPACMRVVELADEPDCEPDKVLAVLRNGYRRGNELLRPCEVMVARDGTEI